jgi:hypothetical protein
MSLLIPYIELTVSHSSVLIILAITIERRAMSLFIPYIELTVSHSSVLSS